MVYPKFRLAMGQILVEGGMIEENLNRAEKVIFEASQEKCKVIILPECLDVGWTHPSSLRIANEIPGYSSNRLSQAAVKNDIIIVAGLTEREGNRIYNSAVLIDRSGMILLKHRKINVLSIAHDLYYIGNTLSVVETEIGTIGVNICADNFTSSQAIGHVLARMGAHFIFSPSSWAVDPDQDKLMHPYGKDWQEWRDSYSHLSKLYRITMVGVSNVGSIDAGPWKGKKVIGGSLAVGPNGTVLSKGPYGSGAEALIIVDIQAQLRDVRGTDYASYLKERGYEGP